MDGYLKLRGRGIVKERRSGTSKAGNPYFMAVIAVMNADSGQALTSTFMLDKEEFDQLPQQDGVVVDFEALASPQEQGRGYEIDRGTMKLKASAEGRARQAA